MFAFEAVQSRRKIVKNQRERKTSKILIIIFSFKIIKQNYLFKKRQTKGK